MRKVKITDGGFLDGIYCPLLRGKKPQRNCDVCCAWFNIEYKVVSRDKSKDRKFAYCGDEFIGEMVEQ